MKVGSLAVQKVVPKVDLLDARLADNWAALKVAR